MLQAQNDPRKLHLRKPVLSPDDLAAACSEPVTTRFASQVPLACSGKILDAEGRVAAILLKDAISLMAGGAMYRAVSPILQARKRVHKDTNPMKLGLWEGDGGEFGQTRFAEQFPQATQRCTGGLKYMSQQFEQHLPEPAAAHAAILSGEHAHLRLCDSLFTSCLLRLNGGGTFETDERAVEGTVRAVACFRGGKGVKSYLALPRLNTSLSLDSLDLILLRATEPYGLSPVEDAPQGYERIVTEATLRGVIPNRTDMN